VTPSLKGRFIDGLKFLHDSAEQSLQTLHIAVFCLADVELSLSGADDSAFTTSMRMCLEVPGLPLERAMQLVIETGDAPMPRSRQVKRLSKGAGRVSPALAARRSPRPRVDPTLDGWACGVDGDRTEP
jgi:hypothetical protein